MNDQKYIVYQCEMLWNVYTGMYKQWTFYSDGTAEEKLIPKGKLIIGIILGGF